MRLTAEDEQLIAEEIVMNRDTVEEDDMPNEPGETSVSVQHDP